MVSWIEWIAESHTKLPFRKILKFMFGVRSYYSFQTQLKRHLEIVESGTADMEHLTQLASGVPQRLNKDRRITTHRLNQRETQVKWNHCSPSSL